jgi:hypothetical protein
MTLNRLGTIPLSRLAAKFFQAPAYAAVAEPSGKQNAIPFFAKKGLRSTDTFGNDRPRFLVQTLLSQE